jgi:hypothetical protein
VTTITEAVAAGATEIPVADTAGFNVGDTIVINPGGATEETNTIAGFASILLEEPLQFSHEPGEIIQVVEDETPTPEPTATKTPKPEPPRCMTLGEKISLFFGILKRWGAEEGERRYKAKYDLNGDGEIGWEDLEIVLESKICKVNKHKCHGHHHGHGHDDDHDKRGKNRW